jgi:hypothetical protein
LCFLHLQKSIPPPEEKNELETTQWKKRGSYTLLNIISISHIETRLATTNLVEDIDLISPIFFKI